MEEGEKCHKKFDIKGQKRIGQKSKKETVTEIRAKNASKKQMAIIKITTKYEK